MSTKTNEGPALKGIEKFHGSPQNLPVLFAIVGRIVEYMGSASGNMEKLRGGRL